MANCFGKNRRYLPQTAPWMGFTLCLQMSSALFPSLSLSGRWGLYQKYSFDPKAKTWHKGAQCAGILSGSISQGVQGAAQDSDLAADQMAYLQVFRIDVVKGESLRAHTHTVDHYHALVGDCVLHGYDVDMVVSRLGAEGRASHALTFSAMLYILQGKKAVGNIAFTSDVICLAESTCFLYIYHCPATDPNHAQASPQIGGRIRPISSICSADLLGF